jgi:hypothetical protein
MRNPDHVAFSLTGARRRINQVRAIVLPADTNPFDWQRTFRREKGVKASEKVVSQSIAEGINRDPTHPGFGACWKGYERIALECGMSEDTVGVATRAIAKRGWIDCRKPFQGTLTIRLAVPKNRQLLTRSDYWKNPENNNNNGHVPTPENGTSQFSENGTSREDVSTDLSSEDSKGTPEEGDSTSPYSALRLSERRELDMMCRRLGRSLTDFDSLPGHMQLLLASDLQDRTLTYGALKYAFERAGA